MNPLQQRLCALRRRLRFVVTFRGGCWLIALLVGSAASVGALHRLVNLPPLVRALFLVGILSGAVFLAYRYLVRPLWAKTDDLSLALRVEALYPALNDSLASTIQFLEEPANSAWAGSPSLRREAVQQTMRKVQGCDFNKAVDSRGMRPAGRAFLLAGGLSLSLVLLDPQAAWTALARLSDPFGAHTWTRVEVDYRALVPAGQPFQIKGSLSGVLPPDATIDIEYENPRAVQQVTVNVSTDELKEKGSFTAKVDMTRQAGNFRFRVWANDAVSPRGPRNWHHVT